MKITAILFPLLLPILLFAASLSFALGLLLPIAAFDRLWVFTDRPSLIEIITGLWQGGDRLIAFVVGLFSLVFPATKLLVLQVAAHSPDKAHWAERVGVLSKWSMADVLIVALVIFAAKTSGLADAAAQPGIWFYGAATLLSAAAALVLAKEQQSATGQRSSGTPGRKSPGTG